MYAMCRMHSHVLNTIAFVQDTGMWNKIDQIKCIFCEPRGGHKEG